MAIDPNQPQAPGMMPPNAGMPQMPGQGTFASSMGPLMQMAQQSMQGPMNQPVPQMGGQIDPMQHPIIGAIVKALASAAQTGGWTAMMPEERLQRQQMQQQKAETLANLAGTQAYREGMLGYRGGELYQGQEKVGQGQQKIDLATQKQNFDQAMAQSKLDLATEANNWHKDIAEGRLDQGATRILNQAQQFEDRLKQIDDLQKRGLDIRAYQAEIQNQMVPIRQGFLELGQTALAQKGTEAGVQTQTKLQQFALEHPILSSMFGLDDLSKMAGQAQQAPVPGVAPPPALGQPLPGAAAPAVPPATAAPAGGGKLGAKAAQKTPKATGGTHLYFDAAGNPR